MFDQINLILVKMIQITAVIYIIKMLFIGPCHLFGYFSNKKYRKDFMMWMANSPKYKNYKKGN